VKLQGWVHCIREQEAKDEACNCGGFDSNSRPSRKAPTRKAYQGGEVEKGVDELIGAIDVFIAPRPWSRRCESSSLRRPRAQITGGSEEPMGEPRFAEGLWGKAGHCMSCELDVLLGLPSLDSVGCAVSANRYVSFFPTVRRGSPTGEYPCTTGSMSTRSPSPPPHEAADGGKERDPRRPEPAQAREQQLIHPGVAHKGDISRERCRVVVISPLLSKVDFPSCHLVA